MTGKKKEAKKVDAVEEMTMSLGDMIFRYNAMNELINLKDKISTDLVFKMVDNKHFWKEHLEPLKEKQQTFANDLQRYTNERIAFCEEISRKDENGIAIMHDNVYDIPAGRRVELDNKVAELKAKYSASIHMEGEYNKLLREEVTVQYYPLPQSQLPKEMVGTILNTLLPMIDRSS